MKGRGRAGGNESQRDTGDGKRVEKSDEKVKERRNQTSNNGKRNGRKIGEERAAR